VSGRAECPHQSAAACYREPAGAGAAAAHGTRGHAKAPCRKPAHGATIAVERRTKLVCPDFRPSGSGLAPSSARAGPPSRQRTSRRFIRRPCSHELPDGRWPNRSAICCNSWRFWINSGSTTPRVASYPPGNAADVLLPLVSLRPCGPNQRIPPKPASLSEGSGPRVVSGEPRPCAVMRARMTDRKSRRYADHPGSPGQGRGRANGCASILPWGLSEEADRPEVFDRALSGVY
jgi:hypothetical protein